MWQFLIGVLGYIKAHYGIVEAQGRGSLHFHGIFWTCGFIDPKKFKLKLNDVSFIEDFQIYLDTIIKCDFDDFQGSESNFHIQMKLIRFTPVVLRQILLTPTT